MNIMTEKPRVKSGRSLVEDLALAAAIGFAGILAIASDLMRGRAEVPFTLGMIALLFAIRATIVEYILRRRR